MVARHAGDQEAGYSPYRWINFDPQEVSPLKPKSAMYFSLTPQYQGILQGRQVVLTTLFILVALH